MANRKVNLYKWHRMKKKLISSVISILCCLAVMAVGVYASTTASFTMAISNDISIQIAVVDGTLSAKRRGGVFAQDTLSGSAGQIASVFGTLKDGKDGNNFADYDFIELYNQNTTSLDGVDGNLKTIQDQKLDINVYHNEIEYIFKYEVEENNGAPTYISIDDLGAGGVLGGLYAYLNTTASEVDKERITLTYSYVAGGSDLKKTEPTNWTIGTHEGYEVKTFPVTVSSGEPKYVEIGGNGEGANTCIYIRCYLKYNTSEYGNHNYNPSGVTGSDALNGMVDDADTEESSKASFHREWKFKLSLSSSTATAS